MNAIAYQAERPYASPHAHGGRGRRAMFLVQAALVPATLFGFWLYGWPAFFLWLITILSALFFEFACLRLMGKKAPGRVLCDGSALLTGWLLAMTLPPWAPWWIGCIGAFVAIVIGKQVFGGLGQNVFNPAMVARVVLLISFPLPLTTWIAPLPLAGVPPPGALESLHIAFGQATPPDAMTSASLLGYARGELMRGADLLQAFAAGQAAPRISWFGVRAGSLGESSALLLALGGLFLLAVGVIRWHAPAGMLMGVLVPALIAHAAAPGAHLGAQAHLLSGALLLGAFFIATDYVTSPMTGAGQFIFGLGAGTMTWLIRGFGGYPEGVAFAILFMNALTPLIDRCIRPRIFGRTRAGAALAADASSGKDA
ncbi:MAG: RnfABCDGE type electron transport complex subunit D [Azoarcus sp.]|jgi:RnfABCDGE-type electron transport complex D subunit|nr:RnfABCDGE type electron transport complex subunit D [Azoarcus sp.]